MDLATILALIKGTQEIVVDLLPIFIHRNSEGKIEKISIGVILEKTDDRNAETLRLIAEANAQAAKKA